MMVILLRKEAHHLVRSQKWNSSHRNVFAGDGVCASQEFLQGKGNRIFYTQNITKRRSLFR